MLTALRVCVPRVPLATSKPFLITSSRFYNTRRQGFRRRTNKNFVDDRYDKNEVRFQKETLAKLVHVQNNETEVTLDQLKEENVIDKMLHKSIDRMGFPNLTPVQQKTIKPTIMNNENDIIARAKTGTGKTFAFLIPIFQHLINTKLDSQYMVKSIIITPTRDLALQIEDEAKKLYKNNYGLKKFQCVSLIGGTNLNESIRRMKKLRPNIIIATPGRLIDVLNRYGNEFFRFVDFKVLDEADRLLEIGFKEDLREISNILNEISERDENHIRTMLFSATLDENVQNLSNDIMNKEKCLFIDTIDKNEPEAHEKIDQSMVLSDHFAHNIYAAANHIQSRLSQDSEMKDNYKAILFTPTVKFTKFITGVLYDKLHSKYRDLPIIEFHGQIDQKKRTRLVEQFKRLKSGILICTDVGARGMDFPDVKEVLQIGVPSELSNYIHRIGRTARSGKDGISTLFISKYELSFLDRLQKLKKIEIKNVHKFKPDENNCDIEIDDRSMESFEESIISLISFYRSCIREYHFNSRDLLPQIAGTYGILTKEPEKKMPLRDGFMLERLGLKRNPIANQMFDIKERSHGRYDDDRSYNSNNRSRYRSNHNNRDRSSSRSNFSESFDRRKSYERRPY
ncbi:hypothetical protein KAFR_0B06170 [Kazachstania africana CBS 2517]|uniref:ATP-dependent RNA helicase n=1 Tax=Kazachstania africana (strain ATCC 22294 / BCRC 22015 / CBS 2517 / CECT 1963 / NBRC 1671 / NRRL Y-8276) TaxID=1071382 RepID=H2ARB4_KAZAF|nr:hypothetical protein KAFR_0B06170 [Kazachstania africana CBS 2517]CCF56914.1 hypothetical protein KAFR_0B06170 [Kazachstania africana CBS 2517]